MIRKWQSNLTPKLSGRQQDDSTPANNIGVQNFVNGFQVLHAGVDTLTLSGVCEDVDAFRALCYCVEDRAKSEGGYGPIDINGHSLVLTRAYGVLPYRLVAETGAAWLLPPGDSAQRGFQVRLGPVWLLARSEAEYEAEALAETRKLFGLGDIPRIRHISRVDLCMDVLMTDAEWTALNSLVANTVENRHVITRAKHLEPFINPGTGRATGFQVGKQAICLRLYDKKAEATKPGGYDWPMWLEVYGREIPDGYVVARFEYQMLRDFLKSFEGRDLATGEVIQGIHTLAELRGGVGTLFDYLTMKWFRLAEVHGDIEHKRQDLAVWSALRASFARAFATRWLGFKRVNLRRLISTDVEGLQRQIRGCAKTLAAALAWRGGQDAPVSLRAALYAVAEDLGEEDAGKWRRDACARLEGLRFQMRRGLAA